jgi:hypothetical protein
MEGYSQWDSHTFIRSQDAAYSFSEYDALTLTEQVNREVTRLKSHSVRFETGPGNACHHIGGFPQFLTVGVDNRCILFWGRMAVHRIDLRSVRLAAEIQCRHLKNKLLKSHQ